MSPESDPWAGELIPRAARRVTCEWPGLEDAFGRPIAVLYESPARVMRHGNRSHRPVHSR